MNRLFIAIVLFLSASAPACPPYEVRVKVMDELLQERPKASVLWLRRGEFNRMRGSRQEALIDLEHAGQLEPGLPQVAFQKGMTLAELGRHQEAAEELAHYLKDPGSNMSEMPSIKRLLLLGADMAKPGAAFAKNADARALVWQYRDFELTEMLCAESSFPEAARAARVQSLEALGRTNEAQAELRKLEKEHPGPEFSLKQARLLASQGSPREAVLVLNRALASLGSLAVLEDEALALELGPMKEPAEALQRCERLLKEKPGENRAERLESRGVALKALGKKAESSEAFAQARAALEARPLRARQAGPGKALALRLAQALSAP